MTRRPSLSASHMAVLLVAAAARAGVKADAVFEDTPDAYTARIMAAAVAKGLGLASGVDACRLFHIRTASAICPSALAQRHIDGEALSTVSFALVEARLVSHPLPTAPEPSAPPARVKSDRAAAPQATAEGPRSLRAPSVVMPRGPGRPPMAAVRSASAEAPVPTLDSPPVAPRRSRPRAAVRGVIRLKPVTARALRFMRRFPLTHWGLDEIADLFDVHPDALADALHPLSSQRSAAA